MTASTGKLKASGVAGPSVEKIEAVPATDRRDKRDENYHSSEHFTVIVKTELGRETFGISPVGWVGPEALISATSYLKELHDLIGKILKDSE